MQATNLIISVFHYFSVLNRSHVATIWNFDPNCSLPNVTTQVSLPKNFQIVALPSTAHQKSSIHEFLKPCLHFLQQDIFSPVSLVTYTTGIRNNRACFCHSTNFHCDMTRISHPFHVSRRRRQWQK